MKFLPKPDSLIIIFFTLFLLTIFQYIFFFNVSSNTFKDIVIERMLNDYEYLRTDFSPSNQRKVYNDVMKKSYPGNKRVIDLEVDRLNNLNLANI